MVLRKLGAKLQQRAHDAVHPLQGVVAKGRIRGVAGRSLHGDGEHGDALVRTHGAHAGRFADHRRRGLGNAVRRQVAGAVHRRLFVRRGDDGERLRQLRVRMTPRGGKRQREKALHVAAAEPVVAPVPFQQRERIVAPQRLVARHGVRMPGEHQPAPAATPAPSDQIALARLFRQRQHLHLETQVLQPPGKVLDDAQIALVAFTIRAAHRRLADERLQHLQRRRDSHGWASPRHRRIVQASPRAVHDDVRR